MYYCHILVLGMHKGSVRHFTDIIRYITIAVFNMVNLTFHHYVSDNSTHVSALTLK